jgi:nicotinamide mononucleotide transporter
MQKLAYKFFISTWRRTDIIIGETPKKKFNYYQLSATNHILIIIAGAISTFLIGFYFTTYTNSEMPIIDAFTSVFSVIATFMVIKKVLENWLYWIIIDIMSIYLYFSKDLHLTSILFAVYTIIAFFGYFSWIKQGRKSV